MGIAIFASYMFVLQALFVAFATGASATMPMLDAFGNPLCITSTDPAGTPADDHTAHAALPDCCTGPCNMFAPILSDGDRSTHSLSNPLPSSAAAKPAASDSAPRVFAIERRPGSPRSPPPAV